MSETTEVMTTPLHGLHRELGGRLVEFAGWELPIQYEGVIAEHTWCRSSAALFDVSHMGIVELRASGTEPGRAGPAAAGTVAEALEALTPASILSLEPNRQRYALLTNDGGGVIDDLMVTNRGSHLSLVVNAARREVDLARLRDGLTGVDVIERADLGLLALQGPRAVDALARLAPAVRDLVFSDFAALDLDLVDASGAKLGQLNEVGVSRSGYTGEDGFELMVAAEGLEALVRSLLDQPEVRPAGLGARDTLRLEAGLALYGHELDETISPIEANLAWTVPKRRREQGRFAGAERIILEYHHGPRRKRVGLRPGGRRPVRDGAELRTASGEPAGIVTSGGYGPTVGAPVAMGYVPTELAVEGQTLTADVRGSDVEVTVAPLPFSPHNYHRGNKR
jgi:aminomethyltransferase